MLVSGRGSNLQALIDAVDDGRLDATIAVVISNVPGAPALARAATAGIETLVMPHRGWPSREAYDEHLAAALSTRDVRRRLPGGLHAPAQRHASSTRFPGPVLNVHPSLLPAFPGVDAPARRWPTA